MPVQWTESRIYKLVLSYIRHECLWKHDSEAFNDLEARYDSYLSMIKDMNTRDLTVNEVCEKIKQIRNIYRMELAKINDAFSRGYPYKPKIIWFEAVHEFLSSYISDEETQTMPTSYSAMHGIPAKIQFTIKHQEVASFGAAIPYLKIIYQPEPYCYESLLNVEGESESEEYSCYIPPTRNCQRRYGLHRRPSRINYLPVASSLDTCPTKLVTNKPSCNAQPQTPCHPKNMPSQHFMKQQAQVVSSPRPHNVKPLPKSGDCSPTRLPESQDQIRMHMSPLQSPSQMVTPTKKQKSQRKSGDEFDAFGKSVACQLRQLFLSHALRTQTKIQSLLAEERINSNQEKEKNEEKDEHGHRHRGGSHATQSSRSSRSSYKCNSNFQCPSISDQSGSRTPSHGRTKKRCDGRKLVDSRNQSHHRTCCNKT